MEPRENRTQDGLNRKDELELYLINHFIVQLVTCLERDAKF